MPNSNPAVFLSYASQDAEPAARIADALRAAGVEVWFDQNELVGGDAWDAKIRGKIKNCALFIPIISASTQARREGYFRREWKQAAERTRDMAEGTPFLLPVVIDATRDAEALVPEEFRAVQWTWLHLKDTPASLAMRIAKLLGGEVDGDKKSATSEVSRASELAGNSTRRVPRRNAIPFLVGTIVVVAAIVSYVTLRPKSDAGRSALPSSNEKAAALPESRQYLARALIYINRPTGSRVDLDAAAQLMERAMALDPNDSDIVAASAQVDIWNIYNWFDQTPARREAARSKAARASCSPPTVLKRAWRRRIIMCAVRASRRSCPTPNAC